MANLHTQEVKHVTDIVQVLNSGIDFYTDAKEKVDDKRLAQFFDRMINARRMVKERLQPFAVQEEGKREEGSAFTVEARKVYTKVMGAMSSDKEATYFVFKGSLKNQAYNKESEPIHIYKKDKTIEDVVEASDQLHLKALSKPVTKYYVCFPKVLLES